MNRAARIARLWWLTEISRNARRGTGIARGIGHSGNGFATSESGSCWNCKEPGTLRDAPAIPVLCDRCYASKRSIEMSASEYLDKYGNLRRQPMATEVMIKAQMETGREHDDTQEGSGP